MPRAPGPVQARPLAEIIRLSVKRLQDGTTTKELTETQQQALALLVDGRAMESVAESLGLEESTLFMWMSFDDGFKTALLAAQQRRRTVIQIGVERAAEYATAALCDILSNDAVRPDIRIKAASVALERLRDVSDMPPVGEKTGSDPIGETLRRMGAAVPRGASAAIGVKKDQDGVVTSIDGTNASDPETP